MADERILVIGAGIAGLFSALALARDGRELLIIDKDPPPPEGGADAAFADWKHNGVGHLRHSHAFLARLNVLVKQHHPALHQALLDAGCRELGIADSLPPPMVPLWTAQSGDDDLSVLTSRRTTLELVIRRYVETLPGVTFQTGVFVREAILEATPEGRRIAGVRTGGADEPQGEIRADITLDASGRLSEIPAQLRADGAVIGEEAEDCGILYYTRHYRLRPGQSEPPRGAHGGTGDLGFLKFGLFPGDNGCFSITLAVPEIETELRQKVIDPAVFDAICRHYPGLAPWLDEARTEPVGRVHGMGDLRGHWRDFVTAEGAPAALGYFPIGDAMIRANPLYGRGCSFAAVAAFELKAALEEAATPLARARAYHGRIRSVLRPYFDGMRNQDRAAIKRAAAIRNPPPKPVVPSITSAIGRSLGNDGIAIALRSDPVLLRAAMRDFHMLEPQPGAWLKKPDNWLRIGKWWLRGKRANADRYPPKPGPDRKFIFDAIGLAA
ncbi:MAG: FAD-dependent oxidoreductase [Caulobacteraceae bacterium]